MFIFLLQIFQIPSKSWLVVLHVDERNIMEAPTKGSFQKKIKSVDFFHTGAGGGSTPNPHFFKSGDFQGGGGGLGSNFHTFLSNFIFF